MFKKAAFLFVSAIICIVLSGCSVTRYFTDNKAVPLVGDEAEPHTPVYNHDGWIVARASMHNHTIYSDGSRTPEHLLELARMSGMAILSYNDHREGDICIGKGACLPTNGIEKYGYDVYLDHINRIKESSDDILVLAGIEVMPWFYQAGRAPSLVVMNQNFHFTVYDIDDPEVLAKMPARRSVENLKPEKDPGNVPYQEFVDYIADNGGIVHAVHVESNQDRWIAGSVHAVSRVRPEHVYEIKRLTGFSVLPEGSFMAGTPGGYWDAALSEYLLGSRDTVPWAMADSDYHGPRGSLYRATTLFYMREFTEEEAYRCLRNGKMVALMGPAFQDVFVSEFSVSGGKADESIMFGEKVRLDGPPVIRFSLDKDIEGCTTRLIRNGKVIATFDSTSFEYTDSKVFDEKVPAFYRVHIGGPPLDKNEEYGNPNEPRNELFTNPVFVYFRD